MICSRCKGFVVWVPANYPHSQHYKCLNCGDIYSVEKAKALLKEKEREVIEVEKEITEGPKLCEICGKPRTRGHHHAGHKKGEREPALHDTLTRREEEDLIPKFIGALETRAKALKDMISALNVLSSYCPPNEGKKIEKALQEVKERFAL